MFGAGAPGPPSCGLGIEQLRTDAIEVSYRVGDRVVTASTLGHCQAFDFAAASGIGLEVWSPQRASHALGATLMTEAIAFVVLYPPHWP